MRTAVSLATGYGKAGSAIASAGSLVNLYAAPTPLGAKDDAILLGTPGARARVQLQYPNDELVQTNETLIHAMLPAFDGLVVVAQNGIYFVAADLTWSRIGDGMSGPVSIAWNGLHAAAVNGSIGRWITATTVTPIADADFYPADSVAQLNGYLLFNRKGTGQFFATEPYSQEFEGLAFATAEKDPDKTVGVHATRDVVLVLGEETTEFWEPVTGLQFPFARIPGAVIEHGCAAPATVARYSDFVCWLTPKGVVIGARGYSAQRISDEQIEAALASRRDLWPSARAYAYEEAGQSFYVLTVGDLTLAYAHSTQAWHQRANYSRGHSLARAHAFAFGRHWIGDDSGRLLETSVEITEDAGEPLVAEIVSTPYHAEREFLSVYSVELQTDVGISPMGQDYRVMMSFSDDLGRTWASDRSASIGAVGEFQGRVQWRRLGAARDKVFRFRISDPFRRAILSRAFLEV